MKKQPTIETKKQDLKMINPQIVQVQGFIDPKKLTNKAFVERLWELTNNNQNLKKTHQELLGLGLEKGRLEKIFKDYQKQEGFYQQNQHNYSEDDSQPILEVYTILDKTVN